MNIAVIPARGGSKRIPRKNIKLFHGLPVIAYAIEARIVQRRAYRYSRDIEAGNVISEADLIPLRPCPPDGMTPFQLDMVLNRKLSKSVEYDQLVRVQDFD